MLGGFFRSNCVQRITVQASLIIFDLDRTLTRRDTFLPYLAGFLLQNPTRIFKCIGLPFAVAKFYLGLINNGQLKEAFLSAVLGGMSRHKIEAWTKQFVPQLVSHGLNKKALEVLRGHQQAGDLLVLMTASPDCYVLELGRVLGFEEIICTATEYVDEKVTGRLASANVRGTEKLRRFECLRRRFPNHFITAYADNSSDVPLLLAVDRGILVNGSLRTRAVVLEHGLSFCSWD
jgi:phosphatidylglycerophosphatase C